MSRITEQMLLECYKAYKNNNYDYIPEGMNANSAKMTMLWLDSLFTGKPYPRDGSALQYRTILEHIKEDFGPEQVRKAKEVLLEHCEWSLEKYGKPMIKH